jgi:hypothetical protein
MDLLAVSATGPKMLPAKDLAMMSLVGSYETRDVLLVPNARMASLVSADHRFTPALGGLSLYTGW